MGKSKEEPERGHKPTAWAAGDDNDAWPPDPLPETEGDLLAGKLMAVGRLAFERAPEQDGNALMGRAWRSAMTGEVRMITQDGWPDFDIVDIWTRDYLEATLQEYANDPFLFMPIPLKYRTWIYHDLFLEKKVTCESSSEHGMMEEALKQRCIDVPISAGRWSPICCYGPLILVLCLTGDMFIMLPGILMVLALFALSTSFNNPGYYRYLRLACLAPRLGFIGVVLVRLNFADTLALLGFGFAVLLMVYDFVTGDFSQLWWYRLNCSYEVVKALPNRVFICRRLGAAYAEEIFGTRGKINPSISGLGAWPKNFHLMADINGIIAELRPLKNKDLLDIYDEQSFVSRTLTCVGLGTYGLDRPHVRALDASYRDLLAMCQKFETNLPEDSMLRPRSKPGKAEERGWAEASANPRAGTQFSPVVETNF